MSLELAVDFRGDEVTAMKVHYDKRASKMVQPQNGTALCGRESWLGWSDFSSKWENVTCKNCLKKKSAAKHQQHAA